MKFDRCKWVLQQRQLWTQYAGILLGHTHTPTYINIECKPSDCESFTQPICGNCVTCWRGYRQRAVFPLNSFVRLHFEQQRKKNFPKKQTFWTWFRVHYVWLWDLCKQENNGKNKLKFRQKLNRIYAKIK